VKPIRHNPARSEAGRVTAVIWKCKDGYINYIIQAGQAGAERNIAMVKWLEKKDLQPITWE
jgi:hypothetical protein